MQHHLTLDGLLGQIVSEQQARLTPPRQVLDNLKNVHISGTGDAFLDFSETNRTFFSVVAIPLIESIMKDPATFVQSQAVPELTVGACPSIVQITVRAPSDVDNESVFRLCNLIPVCKSGCIDGGAEAARRGLHGDSSGAPVAGVIRSIVLDGCERVSLDGGRALRDAARRNTFLQLVSVYGCSINPGTELQLARATQANAERMIKTAGGVVNSSALVFSIVDTDTSVNSSQQACSRGHSAPTQPPPHRESSLLRDAMHGISTSATTTRTNPQLAPFPLLRGMLTQ